MLFNWHVRVIYLNIVFDTSPPLISFDMNISLMILMLMIFSLLNVAVNIER